jgi:hypothetical protein
MEQLKNWKGIDLVGQLATGLVPVMVTLMSRHGGMGGFMVSLFALGAWQVVSFFVNMSLEDRGWKSGLRVLYGWVLAALAVFGIMGLAVGDVMFAFMFTMLFAGPVLGVLYFIITTIELGRVNRGGLAVLDE